MITQQSGEIKSFEILEIREEDLVVFSGGSVVYTFPDEFNVDEDLLP